VCTGGTSLLSACEALCQEKAAFRLQLVNPLYLNAGPVILDLQ